MYPLLAKFQLFGREVIIGSYGIMMIVALTAGIFLSVKIGKRSGYKSSDVLDISLLTAAGGLGGAVVIGFLFFLPERIDYGFFAYPVSLVSWGGVIGGLITILLLKKYWKLNILNLLDIGSPGFFIAMAFGRIGCFLGGCCYGIHYNSSISLYYKDPISPASYMVQPLLSVQLISSLVLLISGSVIYFFVLKRKNPGRIFFSSMVLYSIYRFIIEFFRSDSRLFFMMLSDGQLFSIFLFIASIFGIIFINSKKNILMKHISSLYHH